MWNFRKLSVKHKLMVIMMAINGLVLLLVAVGILIKETLNERHSGYAQIASLAEVIALNSTAALIFNDKHAAQENLYALRAKQGIQYACIKLAHGEIFAEYYGVNIHRLQKNKLCNGTLQNAPFYLLPNTIEVTKEIWLDNEHIGSIFIISNVEELYGNLIDYFIFLLGILLLGFITSFLMCSWLQRVISVPITNLSNAMKVVSEQKEYSVRVKGEYDDELSALVQGFNHMLQQIQARDEELARYSTNLEAEIAVRTAELSEANKKRILWLENMASFLRHELKNTTIGVKSSLELIDRNAQDHDAIDTYLGRARRSMGYMETLLESVSNASSLEAAIEKELLQPLNLSEQIDGCVQEYRVIYSDQLIINQCEENIIISGNANSLTQLLDKLISNAVEHSHPGAPITIRLRKIGHHAVLSVINEGVCLPADKTGIFELFVSLKDSKHKKGENLGLGLYIVKLIAEFHGGHVQARDREGKNGVEFIVSVPTYNE